MKDPLRKNLPGIAAPGTASLDITSPGATSGAALDTSAGAPGAGKQIAVALQHLKGEIPTVVASGRGHIAEKILEIAFANGIKVRQDADLAEALSAIELDCPIPINCFEAVAEILRYLYQVSQPAEEPTP